MKKMDIFILVVCAMTLLGVGCRTWGDYKTKKHMQKIETNLTESDSLSLAVAQKSEQVLAYTAVVDSANRILLKEVQYLALQNDSLKNKKARTKVVLQKDTTAADSIIHLVDLNSNQDDIIENLLVQGQTKDSIIVNLTSNRDSLQHVVDSIPEKMAAIQRLNQGVRKEVKKIGGEPFLDFDWGIGVSAMPDIAEPMNFRKWRVGPSLNATLSLHP